MNIKFKKALIIIVDDGTNDTVVLTTDLPTPYNNGNVDDLHLRFDCYSADLCFPQKQNSMSCFL